MKQNLETNQKIDKLLKELLAEVPVLVNFIQNEEGQKEYGCAYYPFWRKAADPLIPKADFVNARWQELVYTLAFLYKISFPGNTYYQDSQLAYLIKPVLLYWVHIQNRDGSFSEWLKDGHEYPPTAFGLQKMVETYKLCPEIFQEPEKKEIEGSFNKAAFWLRRHHELMALNHECGGVAALAAMFSLYKLPEYKRVMDRKINLILKYQDREGWFREIDGADTGYNTVSITQLALAWQYYRSEKLKEIIKMALDFNSYFIYPDNMMGGGMNSRLAMNLDPLGFAMLGEEFHLARTMALSCLDAFREGKIKGIYNSSDYQRCSMLGHMFLFCWRLYRIAESHDFKIGQERLPAQRPQKANYRFKDMGTAIVKTPFFYLASGYGSSLGAVYSYKAGQTLIYSSPYKLINNSGIYINNGKARYYSSNRANLIETEWRDNAQISRGRMMPTGLDRSERWHHPGESSLFKKFLRKNFSEIYGLLRQLNQLKRKWKRKLNLMTQGLWFRRELSWGEGSILVKNEVWGRKAKGFIARENICMPGYQDKDYKLVFNEQEVLSLDRTKDIEYNYITSLGVLKEGNLALRFAFPRPTTVRIFSQDKEDAFRDMNAWGLAIEMSLEAGALDYYIYF